MHGALLHIMETWKIPVIDLFKEVWVLLEDAGNFELELIKYVLEQITLELNRFFQFHSN